MDLRAVGMTMNQKIYSMLCHVPGHLLLIHIHDIHGSLPAVLLAFIPCTCSKSGPFRQTLSQEISLKSRIPELFSSSHVFHIVRAQTVAMH